MILHQNSFMVDTVPMISMAFGLKTRWTVRFGEMASFQSTFASRELPDHTVIGHLDEVQRTSVEAHCEQVEGKDWTTLKMFDSALMATHLCDCGRSHVRLNFFLTGERR